MCRHFVTEVIIENVAILLSSVITLIFFFSIKDVFRNYLTYQVKMFLSFSKIFYCLQYFLHSNLNNMVTLFS